MHAYAEVERVLPRDLRNILVRADARGLERLRGQLLVLVRDEVAAEGELVDGGAFAAEVEDADLRLMVRRVRFYTFMVDRQTFGSGTPRLYLDFGYGLFLQ